MQTCRFLISGILVNRRSLIKFAWRQVRRILHPLIFLLTTFCMIWVAFPWSKKFINWEKETKSLTKTLMISQLQIWWKQLMKSTRTTLKSILVLETLLTYNLKIKQEFTSPILLYSTSFALQFLWLVRCLTCITNGQSCPSWVFVW